MGDQKQPFSQLNYRDKLIEVGRWIVFIPGSFLAMIAASLFFTISNSPGCTRGMVDPSSSLFDLAWLTVFKAVLSHGAAVVAGGIIAPRGHFVAGLIVATIYLMIQGANLLIIAGVNSSWIDYVEPLCCVIGILGGVLMLRDMDSR